MNLALHISHIYFQKSIQILSPESESYVWSRESTLLFEASRAILILTVNRIAHVIVWLLPKENDRRQKTRCFSGCVVLNKFKIKMLNKTVSDTMTF
ncbi:hypothetical protein NQ317_008003 [Molorchus minor]|uniref:Uncharacterized protein n=1 Tax=Molorchus minor TaxID=1323400 RepID=A0ABQ9IVP4_9CUCU|nr:hypothetical protein NQ317_008003 [Molorchus minor]